MTSVVWKYFNKIEKNVAKCNICSKELKTGGGTSNLRHHLKHKHPDLKEDEEVQNIFDTEKADDGSTEYFGNIEIKYGQSVSSGLNLQTPKKASIATITAESDIQDDSPVVYMVSNTKKRQRKRKISIPPIEKINANKLNRISEDTMRTPDDAFEHFCKSLACHLRKMPEDRALICQEKLQSVITQERLQQLRTRASISTSTDMQESIIVNYQPESEATVSVEFP